MQRRHLVRGVFAAPVVLKVVTAPALASSSSTRCFSNQAANPTIPPPVDGVDAYVRVYLYIDDTGSYWVHGNDLHLLQRMPGASVAKIGEWQRFDLATNRTGEITTTFPSGVKRSTKAVAVLFNSSGQVVGLGASAQGTAISGSCWASFNGVL